MYGSHSCYSHVPILQYSYCIQFQSSLSLYQCTLLPICTVPTAVTAMYQYYSTVTVYNSNPHCHYISAHCYQYVRSPQLLQPCVSTAVHLLYTIPILTVTISVHTVTNMYGPHSCYSHVPVLQYSYCIQFQSSLSLYQCTLLPICTVATAVTAMCQYCSTVTVYNSNPHCHYISAHCYQYVR